MSTTPERSSFQPSQWLWSEPDLGHQTIEDDELGFEEIAAED